MEPPELRQPGGAEVSPRRDRTVRAPGQRGGHYRRIWSERLHKFYIKYGDEPQKFRVQQARRTPVERRSDKMMNLSNERLSMPDMSHLKKEDIDDMFQGLYTILLQHFHRDSQGSGGRSNADRVDFGNLTPLHGDIVTRHNIGVGHFHLIDEQGNEVHSMRRKITDAKAQKEFFCYMTARYVLKYALEKQKVRKALQNGIGFSASGGDQALGESLRKQLRQLEMERQREQLFGPERVIHPLLPVHQINDLSKSLQNLRSIESPKKEIWIDDPISKSLFVANLYMESMQKSKEKDIYLRNAQYVGRLYGHIGSGSRGVFRRPGRPPGTGRGLTAASAGMKMEPVRQANVRESTENWRKHPELVMGARVKVQHPYDHEAPVWGLISGIGEHGIQVTDHEGNVSNIRWKHIHEVSAPIRNTPQNAFEVAKLHIPVKNLPIIGKHEEEDAGKVLRKLGMQHIDDMIHDNHDDRNAAYSFMIENRMPVDPIEATRAKDSPNKHLEAFAAKLIDQALAQNIGVDPKLLVKLPFDQIVSVLHHHLNNKGKQKDE